MPADSYPAALDPDGIVAQARGMIDEYGFTALKLKGGVFPPDAVGPPFLGWFSPVAAPGRYLRDVPGSGCRSLAVPTSPGLGIELDREALARLHQQYVECGIRERDDASPSAVSVGRKDRQPQREARRSARCRVERQRSAMR
jgi:hypothetical protein